MGEVGAPTLAYAFGDCTCLAEVESIGDLWGLERGGGAAALSNSPNIDTGAGCLGCRCSEELGRYVSSVSPGGSAAGLSSRRCAEFSRAGRLGAPSLTEGAAALLP